MKNQSGYSLLELVITIVIIGLLMSLAAPCYLTLASKARVVVARQDVATISQAVEIYALEHNGTYPATLNVLLQGGKEANLLTLPLDPWGNVYHYNATKDHVVYSYGADGVAGGVKYNTDIYSNRVYDPTGLNQQQQVLQLLQ